MPYSQRDIERFWEKVDKTGDCWLWTASVQKSGYGKFGVGYRVRSAHRVAWELQIGEIAEGLHVLHRCNVKLCVNAAHLYLGTQANNTEDAIRDGLWNPRKKILSAEGRERIRLGSLGREPTNKKYFSSEARRLANNERARRYKQRKRGELPSC